MDTSERMGVVLPFIADMISPFSLLRGRRASWLLLPAVALFVGAACFGGSSDEGGLTTSSAGRDGDAGDPSLEDAQRAPEFPGGHTWFNVSQPLALDDLRGKFVLLDFWTSGCINCQHIIPDLSRLEEEFPDELVVIGVHSGKYDREQEDQSVQQSILRLGLRHPVVNDPDFVIWSIYGANAWPTLILIDPLGNVVGGKAGEDVYPVFQPVIAELLEEFEAQGLINRAPLSIDLESAGVSSTFLSFPSTVLADEEGGRLFIADAGHDRVLVAGLDGELRDVIGSGRAGFDDGGFDEATLREPQGLALSEDGNTLYIADTRNHAVRAADLSTREIETIAGTGERAYNVPADGSPADLVALASPWGLVLLDGTLYVAMAGTHQIWTLDPEANTVALFAGSGIEGIVDGPALEAQLAQPSGLATDGTSLYWVGPESSSVRRLALDRTGNVETLVGTGLFDFGDADGTGTGALLEHPQGIAFAGGRVIVADTYNHKLRTVDPSSREVKIVAGGADAGFADGPVGESLLSEPNGLSVANGIIYVADSNNHLIRLFDLSTNSVSTLELTNLAAVARGVEGTGMKVSLEGQTVGPETTTLRLRFEAPGEFHMNSLTQSELVLSSSNPPVLELGEQDVSWISDEQAVEVVVPVSLDGGDAVLTAQGQVYYCRTGDEGICVIENVDISLPVTVAPGASQAEVVLDYTLPEPPANG